MRRRLVLGLLTILAVSASSAHAEQSAFSPKPVFSSPGVLFQGVVALDADHLVLTTDRDLRLLERQARAGGWTETATLPLPPAGVLAVADVDQDGHGDLLLGDPGGLAVRFGRAHGIGPEHRPTLPPGSGAATSAAVADVDRDGRPDVVLQLGRLGPAASPGVAVLRGRPHRVLEPQVRTTPTLGGAPVSLADVTGDGRLDLLVNGAVHPGRRAGGFASARGARPDITSQAVGDVTGDGRPDLVLSTPAGLLVRVGTPTGLQTARPFGPRARPDSTEVPRIELADLDGDARADLLESSGNTVDERRSRPTGPGPPVVLPALTLVNAAPPAVLDVDADGRQDLLVAAERHLVILHNQGLRPRSRLRLAASAPRVDAAKSVLVRVSCTRGAGVCSGSVRPVGSYRQDVALTAGHATALTFPSAARAGTELRVRLARSGLATIHLRLAVPRGSSDDARTSCLGLQHETPLARAGAIAILGDSYYEQASGCDVRTGLRRFFPLDESGHVGAAGQGEVATAGSVCGDAFDPCNSFVVIVSMATGRALRTVASRPADCDGTPSPFGCSEIGVGGLVLGVDGTAAWITCAYDGATSCGPGVHHVELLRTDGTVQEVADGAGIRARSLRTTPDGRAVTWRQDGSRRTAALI